MNYHHFCPSCRRRIATFNPRQASKKDKKERNKPEIQSNGYKPLVSVSVKTKPKKDSKSVKAEQKHPVSVMKAENELNV